MSVESFAVLASQPASPTDELSLALAGELREVDADAVLAELERLGAELGPRRRWCAGGRGRGPSRPARPPPRV